MRKQISCGYLYRDGHGVVVWKERHRLSGETVEWVEIHEKFGPMVQIPENSCLLLTRGAVNFARSLQFLSALKPSVEAGTERTKALGIPVSCFELQPKTGGSFLLHTFPTLCGSDLEVIDGDYTFAEDAARETWGALDKPVARIHRAKDSAEKTAGRRT